MELLDDGVEKRGVCPENFTMPGKKFLSSSQPEDKVVADDFPMFDGGPRGSCAGGYIYIILHNCVEQKGTWTDLVLKLQRYQTPA